MGNSAPIETDPQFRAKSFDCASDAPTLCPTARWFPSSEDLKKILKIEGTKPLGKGTSCVVYRGLLHDQLRREWCRRVAIKVIDKDAMHVSRSVLHEVEIMRELVNGNHFVQLYDFLETPNKYFLALQYMEGPNLQRAALNSQGSLEEEQVAFLMRQMLESVSFLHARDICHRDIKPHNFFLNIHDVCSKSVLLKLGDFGMAIRISPGSLATSPQGTLAFKAPEILLLPKKSRGYDHKVDVWALGICMVFLLASEYPHIDGAGRLLMARVLSGEVMVWQDSALQRFFEVTGMARKQPSKQAQDLVMRLLTPEPKERVAACTALHHPWVRSQDCRNVHWKDDLWDQKPRQDWTDFDKAMSELTEDVKHLAKKIGNPENCRGPFCVPLCHVK
mmetsp:Transcript_99082/g.171763  ORF Transcript_99082/g.171763 Transcript_99082/m.171763 type:complete len:390 (+) Transcript_99082:29-1198(+)